MIRKVVYKLHSTCTLHLFLSVPCKRCPVGVPRWPSGCEGKLGVALESLQGRRDLT